MLANRPRVVMNLYYFTYILHVNILFNKLEQPVYIIDYIYICEISMMFLINNKENKFEFVNYLLTFWYI